MWMCVGTTFDRIRNERVSGQRKEVEVALICYMKRVALCRKEIMEMEAQ